MPSMIMLTDHGKVLPAQRMEWMSDDHVEAWIPSRTLTRIARLARIRNRRDPSLGPSRQALSAKRLRWTEAAKRSRCRERAPRGWRRKERLLRGVPGLAEQSPSGD
jgi:hypothetical protein